MTPHPPSQNSYAELHRATDRAMAHIIYPDDEAMREAIRRVVNDPTWTLNMDVPTFVMNVCQQAGRPYRAGALPKPGELMYDRVMRLAEKMPEVIVAQTVTDLTPDSDFLTPGPGELRVYSARYGGPERRPAA